MAIDTPRIYIASKFDRGPEIFMKLRECGEIGFDVRFCRWPIQEVEADNEEDKRYYALMDLSDISMCDYFVLLNEEFSPVSPGRMIEFGYASALRKKTIVVGQLNSVFFYQPNVIHADNWDDALSILKKALDERSA